MNKNVPVLLTLYIWLIGVCTIAYTTYRCNQISKEIAAFSQQFDKDIESLRAIIRR